MLVSKPMKGRLSLIHISDEGSPSFSFRDGNQANQNQERENGLRSFIGDIFEKEAGNDLLGDAFQNQSWNGTTGLNIRV